MMGFKLMVTKSRYYFLEFIPYYRRKIGCCSTLRSVTLTKSKFLKLSKISINKNEVVGRAGEPDSPFLSPLIHSTCWNVSIVCLSNTILTTFYNHLWVYNFFRCETKQKVVPVFFRYKHCQFAVQWRSVREAWAQVFARTRWLLYLLATFLVWFLVSRFFRFHRICCSN